MSAPPPSPRRRDHWPRRLIAWLGHAPGLWLVYREPLPRPLWRANALAVGATLAAMAATWALWSGPHPAAAVLLVWAVGHVAWGSVLAWRLPPRSAPARQPPRASG